MTKKAETLSLHDIYGTPFKVTVGPLTLEVAPPNILYFEKLLRLYNLRAMEIEPRLKATDALDGRIQAVTMLTQMLHVALDQANPEDAWDLNRTASLVQQYPEVLDQYMLGFSRFMPKEARSKK